jgi:PTH1 family peptidyl-tRNA hydrolase
MRFRFPFFSSSKNKATAMKPFLIVGLGNIGPDYSGTRHNIGFDVVDSIAKKQKVSFETVRLGDMASYKAKGKTIYLLKPSTFMNRSGKAVRHWMQQKKIPLERLLIVTDDIHLDFGYLRMRQKGSAGGHNGLKDICAQLNTTSYTRLRFGVGNAFGRGKQVDFVLQAWNKDEGHALPLAIDKAVDACLAFVFEGVAPAMNQYNGNALES